MNHPLLLVLLIGSSIYVAALWRHDYAAAKAGHPNPNAFPGATPAPFRAILIAVVGTLALLGAETAGEIFLGIATQQSHISALFAFYSVMGAAIIEELIFRGWLVVESQGRPTMWAAAMGASIAFALLHPFLWRWEDAGFELTLGTKGWFSTAIVFAMSFWLYAARLASWNPQRSLLPCFAGHAAKNLGVVIIKACCGYVDGWW